MTFDNSRRTSIPGDPPKPHLSDRTLFRHEIKTASSHANRVAKARSSPGPQTKAVQFAPLPRVSRSKDGYSHRGVIRKTAGEVFADQLNAHRNALYAATTARLAQVAESNIQTIDELAAGVRQRLSFLSEAEALLTKQLFAQDTKERMAADDFAGVKNRRLDTAIGNPNNDDGDRPVAAKNIQFRGAQGGAAVETERSSTVPTFRTQRHQNTSEKPEGERWQPNNPVLAMEKLQHTIFSHEGALNKLLDEWNRIQLEILVLAVEILGQDRVVVEGSGADDEIDRVVERALAKGQKAREAALKSVKRTASEWKGSEEDENVWEELEGRVREIADGARTAADGVAREHEAERARLEKKRAEAARDVDEYVNMFFGPDSQEPK